MKLCSACSQTLPQSSFSKKQWQLKQYRRRCKECIGANRKVQLKDPAKKETAATKVSLLPCAADDNAASCWICLDAGYDDDGQPLRRDCSCRGTDAGFAHLSCIVEYAKQKSKQWDGYNENEFDLDQLATPWKDCPGCNQPYQNELALDLATNFVTFVEEIYADDQVIHLEALSRKLFALKNPLPAEKGSAKQVASKMHSMIRQIRNETHSLPQVNWIGSIEANMYSHLGVISEKEGTKESAMEALGHFEKQRDISKAIGYQHGITSAEYNIALTLSKCEGGAGISVDERLRRAQVGYTSNVERFGQDSIATIDAGMQLAIALKNAHHGIESERLLTKLASTSKRVHGPDHQLTQQVESYLQACKLRKVGINFVGEMKRFQALRYEDDGKKCIVQGPIANPRNVQEEKTFKVVSKYIKFTFGTPVVCRGLNSLPHLNGKHGDLRKDEETGYYKVHFEDKELEPCTVELDNIRILFLLPVEL